MRLAIIAGTLTALIFSTIAYAGNCYTNCQRIGNQTYCNTSCY